MQGEAKPCPTTFKKLIKEYRILEPTTKPGEELNISDILLGIVRDENLFNLTGEELKVEQERQKMED